MLLSHFCSNHNLFLENTVVMKQAALIAVTVTEETAVSLKQKVLMGGQ